MGLLLRVLFLVINIIMPAFVSISHFSVIHYALQFIDVYKKRHALCIMSSLGSKLFHADRKDFSLG